jgi:putative component of toxin-antitoxin plasmid stabilization module
MDGDTLVILLGGGTKQRQNKNIEAEQAAWKQYKLTKRI